MRGARLLGITWEESSHQQVDDPPQAVRDAVKIAAKHAALCRVVFLVSESPQALSAVRPGEPLSLPFNLRSEGIRCGG